MVAPYVQDDWKVTSRLTLNLGFRWDYDTNPVGWAAPVAPGGPSQSLTTIIGSHVPSEGIVVAPGAPLFSPVRHVWKNNPNLGNVGPRFGFAYDPFAGHKTSIRGGFGMFYDPTASRLYESNFINSPPAGFSFVLPALFPNPCPTGTCPAGSPGEFAGVDYLAPHGSPYQMQYNLNIQREIAHDTVLSVGYVGSVARHLWTQGDINPPQCVTFPDCTALPQIPKSKPTASGGGSTVNAGNSNVADPAGCIIPSQTSCYGSGVQFPYIVLAFLNNLEVQGPRINASYGSVIQAHNSFGSSSYNSLQVSLNRQFAHDFAGQVNYTYSRCVDNGSFASSLEEWAQL